MSTKPKKSKEEDSEVIIKKIDKMRGANTKETFDNAVKHLLR
jgi:hypothetical protein